MSYFVWQFVETLEYIQYQRECIIIAHIISLAELARYIVSIYLDKIPKRKKKEEEEENYGENIFIKQNN